ncbi:MAG: YkgJ family cysteine cluster protein [Candidatus Methanoperedens sp.]
MIEVPKFTETCQRCTIDCCSKSGGHLYYSYKKIIEIAYYLNTTVTEIKQKYMDRSNDGDYYNKTPCGFFDKANKLCLIDPVKIELCWKYPFVIIDNRLLLHDKNCLYYQENTKNFMTIDGYQDYLNGRAELRVYNDG